MFKAKHCCLKMRKAVNFSCDIHKNIYDCPDALIIYSPKFDEYGIIIHDGGTSNILIKFCPFCGKKLPNSKRNKWFNKMEKLGIDINNDKIPKIYLNYGWWLKKGSYNPKTKEKKPPVKNRRVEK